MHTAIKREQVASLFCEKGLRCTRQRMTLFEALAATRCHPTADELHKAMDDRGESMSLATVYNTLEAFCNAGIVQRLPGKGGSARYDAAIHNHLHLRDKQSGEVVDVPDDLSDAMIEQLPSEMLKQIAEHLGFEVHQIQIELVGKFTKKPATATPGN